jgi:hypothetical protein
MYTMSTFEVSGVMKFNAIVNNISVISWRSVLLVVETGVTREIQRPTESHRQTLLKVGKIIVVVLISSVKMYTSYDCNQ